MTTDRDAQHATGGTEDDPAESLQRFAHTIQEKAGAGTRDTGATSGSAQSWRPSATLGRQLTVRMAGIMAGAGVVLGFLVGRFFTKRSG